VKERATIYRRRNLYGRVLWHLKRGLSFARSLAHALFDRRKR
jgi:hypothetical protein